MNRELIEARKRTWYSYHIPSMTPLHRVKKNAVFISAANTLRHETKKLEVCYQLKKEGKEFITEAVENQSGLRRDVVCLDDGQVFECECDKNRAKRHGKEINVIMVEDET